MEEHIGKMIPEAEGPVEMRIDYERNRQERPVSRVILMQDMEDILPERLGYIRKFTEELVVFDDEDIVIEVAKTEKGRRRIEQKTDEDYPEVRTVTS